MKKTIHRGVNMGGNRNSKIIEKIENSNFEEPVKDFLKSIFIFELKNSNKERYNYSDVYDKAIKSLLNDLRE